jgi:hypothetical protein
MTKSEFFTPIQVELDSEAKQVLHDSGYRCFAMLSKPYDHATLHHIGQELSQFHGSTILIIDNGTTTFWAIPPDDLSDRPTLTQNPIPKPEPHPTVCALKGDQTTHENPITTLPAGPPDFDSLPEVNEEGDRETHIPLLLKRPKSNPPPLPIKQPPDSGPYTPVDTTDLS